MWPVRRIFTKKAFFAELCVLKKLPVESLCIQVPGNQAGKHGNSASRRPHPRIHFIAKPCAPIVPHKHFPRPADRQQRMETCVFRCILRRAGDDLRGAAKAVGEIRLCAHGPASSTFVESESSMTTSGWNARAVNGSRARARSFIGVGSSGVCFSVRRAMERNAWFAAVLRSSCGGVARLSKVEY